MSESVRVREAGPRDALEILDLKRQVLAEGNWFIKHPDEYEIGVEVFIRQLALLQGSTLGTFRAARLDGRVVGFVSLRSPPFRRMRHVVKLEIAVAEGYRDRQIGRALLTNAIGWAQSSPDIHKIGLAVFSDNVRALALYRSLGFLEEGRRVAEYRMDDGSFRDDVLLYLPVGGSLFH